MESDIDDELFADISSAARGERPPVSGEVSFEIDVEPLSQGASGKGKAKLRSKIQGHFKRFQFLLSGDVKVEIRWMVHPVHRYESHKAVDIDNIIKPILDSLRGPGGLFIDDTQVQEVVSYWMDWPFEDRHRVDLTIKFGPDEFVQKDLLEFIEFDRRLCFPFSLTFKAENSENARILIEFKLRIIEMVELGMALSDAAIERGVDWTSATSVRSCQRLFHRNKLDPSWKVTPVADAKRALKEALSQTS